MESTPPQPPKQHVGPEKSVFADVARLLPSPPANQNGGLDSVNENDAQLFPITRRPFSQQIAGIEETRTDGSPDVLSNEYVVENISIADTVLPPDSIEYVADGSTSVPPAYDSSDSIIYVGHFERPRTSETRGNDSGNPDAVLDYDEIDDASHGMYGDARVYSGGFEYDEAERNENPNSVASSTEPFHDDDDVEMTDGSLGQQQNGAVAEHSYSRDRMCRRYAPYSRIRARNLSGKQATFNEENHALPMVEEDVEAAGDSDNALLDELQYLEDQFMNDQEDPDSFGNQNEELAADYAPPGIFTFQSNVLHSGDGTYLYQTIDGYLTARVPTTGFDSVPFLFGHTENGFVFGVDPIVVHILGGELTFFISGVIRFPYQILPETFACWIDENFLCYQAQLM